MKCKHVTHSWKWVRYVVTHCVLKFKNFMFYVDSMRVFIKGKMIERKKINKIHTWVHVSCGT